LTPLYSMTTGSLIPEYTGITIQNFHAMGSVTPRVTLLGFDAAHVLGVTLDNVVIDGIAPANVSSSNASITLGPGSVNFTPAGQNVTVTNSLSGSSQPNPCAGKWVTF